MLKLYEGKSSDQVQAELTVGREAVAKWKPRFLKLGIKGLMDKRGNEGAKVGNKSKQKSSIEQKISVILLEDNIGRFISYFS